MADLPVNEAALIARIHELEARLRECDETLDAIRRGAVDAVVVSNRPEDHRVYTLESADRPYQVLVEQMQEGAVTLTEDGTVLYCNRRVAELLGIPQERVIGHRLHPFIWPADLTGFDRLLAEAKAASARGELTLRNGAGAPVPVQVSLSRLQVEGSGMLLCGVLTDLTRQKLHLHELAETNARLTEATAQRERVEAALRQSQKMEAVGQLTGGLAHDFNNLLTGISGSLELMSARIAQGRVNDLERYSAAALGACKRAAALTHRMLAFSRRQVLDPKPTDVNRLVAGMVDLIRRTMGPQITVETISLEAPWTTFVDPNQLENALLNLCINARDAMPDGGRLRIEIVNRPLDAGVAGERDLPPGDYVALCVGDTGTGMTKEVADRAFDPFFTTKPIGVGTGLGLSMIHGFARQSGGQVRICSEPGRGTTICVYLPRHRGEVRAPDPPPRPAGNARAANNETVLVVEDEPTIRMLVSTALTELGYAALEASDGAAGLRVLDSGTPIDLLVTDVGLPGGMNGRQMADAARVRRPGLKVLFITGYAESAVLAQGNLEPGMHVLTKPFPMEILAARVTSLIGSG